MHSECRENAGVLALAGVVVHSVSRLVQQIDERFLLLPGPAGTGVATGAEA